MIAAVIEPHLTVAAHVANVVRLFVMFLGGSVIGAGLVVLHGRARFYARIGMPTATRCMYVLAAMNVVVLGYATLNLVARWGHSALGWPTFGAALVFVWKAWFFILLRKFGLEQDRELLYGRSVWPHTV